MENIVLFIIFLFAGALNSIAGGGTFITFPALLFSGMPAITANATSSFSLWPASMASAYSYKSHLNNNKKFILKLSSISFFGGVLGSVLLLFTPEEGFKSSIPYLLLFATVVFSFGSKILKKIKAQHFQADVNINKKQLFLMFIIAVYGGFFGAGIGIMMLALFEFIGIKNIHQSNMLKTIQGSVINGITVLVFIIAKIINYKVAIIMSFAAVIGGYFGAKIAQKTNPILIKSIIITIAWLMTIYSFYKF